MKLDNRNNTFTIKEAIKSIVYQLRICKQKTTNVTPFQAHFGRKPNTPLSNISIIPKSSNLSFDNILHHYLDADTVPVKDYLDDNGWVTGDRSDILKEKARQKAHMDAGRRYNGDKNKSVARFIMHPKLKQPDTGVRKIVRHQTSSQSVRTVKEGPPRTLGNVVPRLYCRENLAHYDCN